MSGTNPFLGARPYGPADDQLFFGRKAAALRLVERIDLHRLTILTSPSGLGKTSLLRASVLPRLERSGLSPVYLRPDPTGGADEDAATTLLDGRLVTALAQALLPDPALESKVIEQICKSTAEGITLADAARWFESLPADHRARMEILDPARTEILEPAQSKDLAPPEESHGRLSMIARYLRGSFTLAALERQAMIMGMTMSGSWQPDNPLRDLLTCFGDSRFAEAASRALKEVCELAGLPSGGSPKSADGGLANPTGESSGVRMEPEWSDASGPADHGEPDELLDPICRLCGTLDEREPLIARPDGDHKLSVRIVLVIDQFEQLFTLARPGTRHSALDVLAKLLFAPRAPIHLVLSLRKEWYADLVRLLAQRLRINDPPARTTFHLEPMTYSEAIEVMVEAPRRIHAREIEEKQRAELWRLLQTDDAMDAVVLSIACHELFAAGSAAQSAITEAGMEGLFRTYLDRSLKELPGDVERDDALDILGEIAGTGSTRSFVTISRLINAPLHDPQRRRRALNGLQKAFLIKGENPGRGLDKVYDIMHERLLSPVRQLLDDHPDIALFREAADRVTQRDTWEQGITWQHCVALLSQRQRVAWNSRAAGVLLASLLRELTEDRLSELARSRGKRISLVPTEQAPRAWLRLRLRELAAASAHPAPCGISVLERTRLSWWMTAAEIRDRVGEPAELEADQLALQSGLHGPAGWMRDELRKLAMRVGGADPRRGS